MRDKIIAILAEIFISLLGLNLLVDDAPAGAQGHTIVTFVSAYALARLIGSLARKF